MTKPDGTKFGKTEAGALYLDARRTSPYALYQYFYRVEDSVVGTYLRYFTFNCHEQLLALDDTVANEPANARSATQARPRRGRARPLRRRRPSRRGRRCDALLRRHRGPR